MKRAQPSAYIVQSLLFCDDIRVEITGKELLVGVYNDGMVVSAFPAFFTKLMIRLTIAIETPRASTFAFRFVGDDGTTRADIKSPCPAYVVGRPTTFAFAIPNLGCQGPTRFTASFGIDSEPKVVGHFDIRFPEDEVERERAIAAGR